MAENRKTLGILGGMGPAASAHFLRLVIEHTKTTCDSDHVDVIMTSRASTPDRTAYITGKCMNSPLQTMEKDVGFLVHSGAEAIAVPCNTAMYFIDTIRRISPVIVFDIVDEAVKEAWKSGAKRVGVLATDGTIYGQMYQNKCMIHGITPVFPEREEQSALMNIIYSYLKVGSVEVNYIYSLLDSLLSKSDIVILGCTELSMIDLTKYTNKYSVIDSSEVLAKRSIEYCGGISFGFDKKHLLREAVCRKFQMLPKN